MKPRRFFSPLLLPATLAMVFSMAQVQQASALTWDPGQTPVTPSGGTGAWNLTDAFWSNGGSDVAWTDTTGTTDTAVFGGTAGTVTLGANLGALGLVFNTSGYTISGASALTLGTAGIDASALVSGTTTLSHSITLAGGQSWNTGAGSNLAVTGVISGANALTKTGAGTLTLSGVNTFSGGLTISQGVVSFAANNQLGGAGGTAGAVLLNGGTLQSTAAGTFQNTHAITVGASGGAITILTPQIHFDTAATLLGSGALAVNGGGTLVANTGNLRLTKVNSYSGAVTLQNGGSLEYGINGAIGAGATITVANQGEVIVQTGVTLTNGITVTGGTNSVISFENGNAGIYSGTITMNAATTIGLRDWYNYATVRNGTISGKLTGAGPMTVNSGTGNGGLLTLSNAANDYSGGTTINAAKVLATTSGSLGSGAVSVTGANGQLQVGNGTNIANSLTINGGGVLVQGALFATGGTATYSGAINITAAAAAGGHFAAADNATKLIIAGDNTITSTAVPVTVRLGNVVYSGAQNYTGGTSLTGGLLQFSKITSMPDSGTVAAATGSTVAVNVGGAGEFTHGTGTSTAGTIGGLLGGVGGQSAPVTFAAGASLGIDTTNAVGEVTYGSNFITANNPGLIKLGTGTLALTAGGTFAGGGAAGFPLVVRAGTLRLNGGTYAVTGETVVGDNVAAGNAGTNASLIVDAGTVTGSGFLSIARGNGTGTTTSDMVMNGSSQVTSVGFGIGFNAGNAANTPKGSLTLNGTSKYTNTATNNTFIIAESAGSVGTVTLNDSSTIQHNGGSAVTRIGVSGRGLLNVNSNTATFLGRALTLGTAAGGVGAVYNKGVLTITQGIYVGDNATAGNTVTGYLRNDNSGAAASSVPQLYIGALSNATGTGHNVFDNISGTLGNISTGIVIGNSATAGTQNGQINVFGGTVTTTSTTVAPGAGNTNKYAVINVMGATSLYTNTGTVNLGSNSDATNTGVLTVNGGGVFSADTITSGAAANSFINLDNGTLRAQTGTSASLVNAAIDRITVYSGGGTIDTGTFNKSVDAVIAGPTGNSISSVSINATGTGFQGRPVVKITDATGTGATGVAIFDPVTGQVTGVTITSAGSGYTAPVISILGGGGTAITATATLGTAASGGLTKIGAGTLTLTAANTYTGATLVNQGKLVVNGSLGNTVTTVASGAYLGGSGTIGGFTTIQTGGHLAPGNSPGITTFSNGLALAAGANLDWELTANTNVGVGTAFDQVSIIGGTLSLSNTAALNLAFGGTVDFTNSFWDTDQQWTVLNLNGGTDGTAGNALTLGTITGGAGDYSTQGLFSVTNQNGSQVLSWTAVPEPGITLLGAIGMLTLLRRRRN